MVFFSHLFFFRQTDIIYITVHITRIQKTNK
jgi:hypothetical protein